MSIGAHKRFFGVCASDRVATVLGGLPLVRLARGSLIIDGRAAVPEGMATHRHAQPNSQSGRVQRGVFDARHTAPRNFVIL